MIRSLSAALAILIATSGCAAHAVSPLSQPVSVESRLEAEVPQAAAPRPSKTNGVTISDELARQCAVAVGTVDDAPKFDFDRADLTASDRAVLGQVAACLTTGRLHGRGLALVGRADPRGDGEYNLGLGARRAGSVASYLAQLGVPQASVTTTSRGSLDATGVDQSGWSRDRRVDVLLASQLALPPDEERRQH